MNKHILLLTIFTILSLTVNAQVKSNDGTFLTKSPADLLLQTGISANAGVTRMTILNSNGFVGIGTTPTEMLHVNGNVLSTQYTSTNGKFNSAGASDLFLSTNNTNRLSILNSNGFVGIGTTPTEMLHVNGNVLSNLYSSSTGNFNSTGTNNLSLQTNGTSRVTVLNTNGFVGIGTTPAEMLHVNGNVLSNNYSSTTGIFNTTGTSDLALSTNGTSRLTVLNTSGFVGIGVNPTEMLHVNGNVLSNQYSAVNGNFNSTSSNLSLSVNGTSRVTVNGTNGFMGVGTSSPEQMLHVNGGNMVVDNGDAPTIYTGTGTTELNRYLRLSNSSGLESSSGLKAGGILVADNYSYANPSKNDLVVKGKVSIGTPLSSNPNNYTLAVNGKIGAKDLQVETKSSAWPDYVFSNDYKLPSLYEVERYIQQHKHLQDVPSASEIEVKHSVAEMDAVLLKKVEELTLYIIEQQKQIDALKAQIEKK